MRCGVIGSPIGHSLSPQLHEAAYAWLGLDWEYSRHEVTEREVPSFIAGLDATWRGLSVTMPCKRAIVAHGQPSPTVRSLGVANTLVFDGLPSDRLTTRVENTDVFGIEHLLTHAGLDSQWSVEVWGNGSTASSAVYALASLGVHHVWVHARDPEKTSTLAVRARGWGIDVVPSPSSGSADLIISTVPAIVAEQWIGRALGARLVFDIVYDPWPTPLVASLGSTTQSLTGLDLLAAQAIGQVELMTGHVVPFDVLRTAADHAMGPRAK